MLLLNHFFTIQCLYAEQSSITADIEINEKHKIFKGHFPGQPVVPGVCMMQIIKEILEEGLDITTKLSKASDLKFLSVINPVETKKLQVRIKYMQPANGQYYLQGELSNSEKCFFKLKGNFIRQNVFLEN